MADDTAALQRALDAMHTGDTMVFAAGRTYRHTAVLVVRVAGAHLTGGGVLLATAEATSSFWIAANSVLVDGSLTFRTTGTTRRWVQYEQMGIRVASTDSTVLRGVTVEGSAAAGLYVGGSSNFLLEDVHVSLSRADGIHMTEGSHHGTVRRPVVTSSGDDGIAVVSYSGSTVDHDISVQAPTVRTTTWGRGLSVVGGEDITYANVDVTSSRAAAVYIATEGSPYYTLNTKRVTVTGGRLATSNTDATIDHGAVLLYSGQSTGTVEDVTVSNLAISDTRSSAPWQVGVLSGGGTVTRAAFRSLTVVGGGSLFWTNLSGGVYDSSGWSWNGAAQPAHTGW